MKNKNLGKTNISVTPVGMGVMTIGPSQLACTLDEGSGLVRYALEQGINFLDTAEYYNTYPYIRQALIDLGPSFSQGALPRPVISSKSLAEGYDDMSRSIEDCRAALNLDQIDIFLLHEVLQPPDFESRRGAWACLNDAKAKGIVRAVGISTHHTDTVLDASKTPGMDIIFPLINYQSLGIRKGPDLGTKEDMENAIISAAERDIGIFTMKALGGGNLVFDYKTAMDYVSALAGVQSVMIGFGCRKDVDDAIAYFEGRMPDGYVPDISHKRMFVDRGDCLGCGACVEKCTSKAIHLDSEGIAEIYLEKCVLCGYCVPVCPSRALIFL